MYEPHERIVEVTNHFYSELSQYLKIEERWVARGGGGNLIGLVLYVMDGNDGDSRKLIFAREGRKK